MMKKRRRLPFLLNDKCDSTEEDEGYNETRKKKKQQQKKSV